MLDLGVGRSARLRSRGRLSHLHLARFRLVPLARKWVEVLVQSAGRTRGLTGQPGLQTCVRLLAGSRPSLGANRTVSVSAKRSRLRLTSILIALQRDEKRPRRFASTRTKSTKRPTCELWDDLAVPFDPIHICASLHSSSTALYPSALLREWIVCRVADNF